MEEASRPRSLSVSREAARRATSQSQIRLCARSLRPVPIDLGPSTDQVFLVLYGTGIRFRSSLTNVSATIGGLASEVLAAEAAPGFVGLDQVNVRLSRALIGRGEVDVTLSVDGRAANTVRVNIR